MRTFRPVVIGTLLCAALLVLAGCGRYPAQITTPGGASADVGAIAIRDARFTAGPSRAGDEAHRAGQDVPLTLSIVNTGDATDRLEAVSSPVASGARVSGDAQILGGFTLVSGDDQGSPARTPTATVRTGIVLTGLREPLRVGLTYPVRFTFARAGTVEVELPVGSPAALPPRADEPRVPAS